MKHIKPTSLESLGNLENSPKQASDLGMGLGILEYILPVIYPGYLEKTGGSPIWESYPFVKDK